jgi:hypothetical protein
MVVGIGVGIPVSPILCDQICSFYQIKALKKKFVNKSWEISLFGKSALKGEGLEFRITR